MSQTMFEAHYERPRYPTYNIGLDGRRALRIEYRTPDDVDYALSDNVGREAQPTRRQKVLGALLNAAVQIRNAIC
jgi:hypothetical protein